MNIAINLKSFALGATLALAALGMVALAVAIPNTFAAGDVISAAKMNANFTAVKTAVDALEAKVSLPGREGYYAYAWVSGAGAPSAIYASNPAGTINVTTSATGVYEVTFGGTHPEIRSVQITSYGSNSNYCKVRTWNPSAVTVLCYTAGGAAVNNDFTITVAN